VKKPFNILLYGVPGVGKTTFFASSPRPIFLGPENLDEIGVDHIQIKSFKELLSAIQYVRNERIKDFETLVIDTIDGVEGLIVRDVLQSDPKGTGSMMAAHGGYGK